jgi:hypothetical protein
MSRTRKTRAVTVDSPCLTARRRALTVPDARRPGHYIRAVFDPLADIEGLRKWMKHCFNVMVRYEVFERKAGREPCWEEKFEMMFVGKVARAFGFRHMELDKDSRAFFKSARKV